MRYCPNCGTEVDDNAVFCPTCGQAIDQATETQMPAAPGWPDPPGTERADPPAAEPVAPSAASAADDATRVERQPAAPIAPQPVGSRDVSHLDAGPPTQQADRPARPAVDLPITMPVTLSGWLIGIGALLAALG